MATDTEFPEILTRKRTPYNDIFVLERENWREMWFQGRGRFYLQSRIDRTRPGDLALVYTRLLLAPLMWNPAPSRVLMIGLGGGVLPRFLHEVFPELAVDVVEVDGHVTELARRYFNLQEDSRLRVFEDDGRAFIQQQDHKYDLVVLDAFKGGSVPYHLKTLEFYREIARCLNPGGMLATNLYGKSNGLKPRDRKTLEAVFGRVTFIDAPDRVATVCLAFCHDEDPSPKQLRNNRLQLPEPVQRNLSWLGNMDMIDNGSGVEPAGSVFTDDFQASEFFQAVKRNNRDDPFHDHPYPIRNSS